MHCICTTLYVGNSKLVYCMYISMCLMWTNVQRMMYACITVDMLFLNTYTLTSRLYWTIAIPQYIHSLHTLHTPLHTPYTPLHTPYTPLHTPRTPLHTPLTPHPTTHSPIGSPHAFSYLRSCSLNRNRLTSYTVMYRVHYVQCTLYNVHYIVYIYTVNAVHCMHLIPVYTILTVYLVHCTSCTLYVVQ